jgi:(1->4)-alpha-D-glucan 1-alpha-D-glucosylmutase
MRARIDVLSELASEWRLHVARWRRFNRARRRKLEALEAPTRNDEYLLYQTLVGAWPDGDMDPAATGEFRERIERYVVKVVREAKAVSSWLNPNEEYEAAFVAFVRGLLSPPGNKRFLADFLPFQRRVAWFGMLNSLAQTLLKLTAPGVPDVYQGCEWWELSLVDPDNRRPVDFAARKASFEEMQAAAARSDGAVALLASRLLQNIADGRIKQFVTWRALEARREHEALFRDGSYVPLPVQGAQADHVCAFARVLGDECAITIAPRLVGTLTRGEMRMPIGAELWSDTRISLPNLLRQRVWRNALTREPIPPAESANALPGASALRRFPLALLVSHGA